MCGITGFIDTPHARSCAEIQHIVARMNAALVHRGPDAGQEYVNPRHGVAFGHRRLSIQDLSPSGAQPMINQNEQWIIVYNGEVYNKQELAANLQINFRGTSDTEIILEHIAAFGVSATLPKLNGIFALAVYNFETRTLYLARDGLGVKPLYYGQISSTCFAFGSELKALKQHPSFEPALNMNAIGNMLQMGSFNPQQCVYSSVYQVPTGYYLELRDGKQRLHQYYSISQVAHDGQSNLFTGNLTEATHILHEKLRTAVQAQMISDVPLGAFLSGGIDSSTVVALMQEASSRPVQTFSIGFENAAYNEAHYAAAVAKHLGTQHTEFIVNEQDALDIIPKLVYIYDEPFADSSQIPTFLVSQLCRQHVTVALSGDGGDECFGGYVRHQALSKLWRYLSPVPQPLRGALSFALSKVPTQVWETVGHAIPASRRPVHFAEKLQKTARLLGANSIARMYQNLVCQWPQAPLLLSEFNSSDSEPPNVFGVNQELMHSISTCEINTQAQLRLNDFQTYLSNDILTKVDRASMAVGLEARVPLLDKNIVEFAWSLPNEMLMQNGVGKLPLRLVLHKYVPAHLFERPKQGFSMPVDIWLRGSLRDWAEDLLSENALKALPYDVKVIRQRWQQHINGTHVWHHSLWHVLMLQAWLKAQKV